GHATGDLPELLEFVDPEIFVHVEVAVVTLGGAYVCTQEIKHRPIGQNDRIALELNPSNILHELDDVLPEHMGLSLGCRQEDFVLAGFEGINDGFPGKVPCGANLPRLQNVADPVMVSGNAPRLLICKERAVERVDKLNQAFITNI